ncbi:MAG: hypothetical protein ACOYJI_00305 [Anaerovoracaceae bacterium]
MAGKIKDILIVVVLLTAFAAAYFICQNYSVINGIRPFFTDSSNTSEAAAEITELLEPEKIIVCDSSGNMFSAQSDFKLEKAERAEGADDSTLYASFVEAFRNIVSGSNELSEIDESAYVSAISADSIAAQYMCDITLSDFAECIDADFSVKGASDIHASVIAADSDSRNTVYIYDSEEGKYYSIKSDNESNVWSSLDDALASVESEGGTAYRFSTSDNSSAGYIPDDQTEFSILKDISFEPEYDAEDDSALTEIEQMFFKDGTDFVRVSTLSDGSVSYRYKYQDKILTVSPSGSISYKEKTDINSYRRTSLRDSLAIALEYIDSHGGMEKNGDVKVCLKSVESSGEDKSLKYTFDFGITCNGMKLIYPDNEGKMLTVTVTGGQVTEYFRDLPSFDSIDLPSDNSDSDDAWTDALPLSTLVEDNKSELASALEMKTADTSVQDITENISMAEICIYRVSAEDDSGSGDESTASSRSSNDTTANGQYGTLVSAWHIVIGDREFWFRAEDGEFIASDAAA